MVFGLLMMIVDEFTGRWCCYCYLPQYSRDSTTLLYIYSLLSDYRSTMRLHDEVTTPVIPRQRYSFLDLPHDFLLCTICVIHKALILNLSFSSP